jgi:hypothetical protein
MSGAAVSGISGIKEAVMPQWIRKWLMLVILAASVPLLNAHVLAEATRKPWLTRMDQIVSSLSDHIDRFAYLQTMLAELSRNNEKYSEQKNIWLSSTLTLAAIASVCEYQRDLIILFTELREKNRNYFYDVRIKSLQLSVEQINVMYQQMQINHSLISHRKEELALVPKENDVIFSSMDLLRQAIREIESNRKFLEGK